MRYRLYLFWQLLRRDIESRYRGSTLGLLWPIVQPLMQLSVFTLIFFEFMQFRWPLASGEHSQTAWEYAAQVLGGLAAFNFFAELLNRSTISISGQSNFVTKVRFPLGLLPTVCCAAAVLHIVTASLVLFMFRITMQGVSLEALLQLFWLPFLLAPFVLYGLSLSLVLGGLGVYFRDLQQVMPAITSLLMFLSPIFYPASSVPASLRSAFELNPIGAAAEVLRHSFLATSEFHADTWIVHCLASGLIFFLSLSFFRRIRLGFADVL